MDFLVRTNIPAELQGRGWGIVGFMSQIGYVIAYGCSGLLADRIAGRTGISVGRGAGIVMAFSGAALIMVSVSTLFIKEIRLLEEHSEIEDWQISNYLNLENSTLFLGSNSLADSTQDNGLSIQGDHFDYLLDMENKCPAVEEGEVSELYYNGPAITKPLIRMMNALYPVWSSRPAVRYG